MERLAWWKLPGLISSPGANSPPLLIVVSICHTHISLMGLTVGSSVLSSELIILVLCISDIFPEESCVFHRKNILTPMAYRLLWALTTQCNVLTHHTWNAQQQELMHQPNLNPRDPGMYLGSVSCQLWKVVLRRYHLRWVTQLARCLGFEQLVGSLDVSNQGKVEKLPTQKTKLETSFKKLVPGFSTSVPRPTLDSLKTCFFETPMRLCQHNGSLGASNGQDTQQQRLAYLLIPEPSAIWHIRTHVYDFTK